MKSTKILFAFALSVCCACAIPQATSAQPVKLTKAIKDEAIDGLVKALNDNYVFPDVAKKMETAFRDKQRKGEYDAVSDGAALAKLLTEHAQEVSKDKHLRVQFHSNKVQMPAMGGGPSPQAIADREKELRRINGGFEKVERLQGNVGYIDFRFFGQHPIAFKAVDSAFGFVQNTDALIIDLRQNGGGSPEMVAYICSYLFDEKPVHLNSLYFRPSNETEEFWTRAELPGPRYLDKPVYVLTSNYTFSGAEEFSYNLRNLKRATIVGETTGGGAHPGGVERLSEYFTAFIPSGRAINPITKTNWEGTGVEPHIKVSAADALKAAHTDAIGKLLAAATSPSDKTWLTEVLERVKKG